MASGKETSLIGSSPGRAEDLELVRGRGLYVGDFQPEGMLDVAFCRSQLAHAELDSIDLAAAKQAQGVVAAFSHEDLDDVRDLLPPLHPPKGEIYSTSRPLLARDRLRYVGEAVAMVVAESRYLAEDACELVEFDAEPIEAVIRVEESLKPGAPVIHEDNGSNVLFGHEFESEGFEEAVVAGDVMIERTLEVPRLAPSPMENRAILAVPTEDGGVHIWYSTQTPYVLRRALADLMDIDPDLIRVTCPHVGGGFGAKSHVYPEDILVPWAALRLGRPVRWLEDRTENLITSCHARGQVIHAKLTATSEGKITAMEADVTVDVGAYGVYPHGQLIEVGGTPNMLTGPYRIDQLKFRARAVATNLCPGGGYRGVGLASAVFVHERMIEVLARELDLDPIEIRRRNLLTKEDLPWPNPRGLLYDSGDYPAAMQLALDHMNDFDLDGLTSEVAERGNRLGLGLCCYNEYTGMGSNVFRGRGMVAIVGYEEARISVRDDGSVLVRPTVPTTGQGSATAFAQVVAQELSIPLAKVEVRQPDTHAGPDGSGNFGSRGTVVGGTAMIRASAELRSRLIEVAARHMRVTPEELELKDGKAILVEEPDVSCDFGELAQVGESYLDVTKRYDPTTTTFSYGTHACLVEVDPRRGDVTIRRYVIVDDCGRLINPMLVDGQAFGSTTQGLGAAFLEAFAYDDLGQPQTSSFADYLLPTAAETPDFISDHLETMPLDSPGGFRGAGEGGTVAAPPAYVNAVANAIDGELNAIPVTPEDICIEV